MINILLNLLVLLLILGLVYWAFTEVLGLFSPPPKAFVVLRVVFVVLAIIIVVSLLTGSGPRWKLI